MQIGIVGLPNVGKSTLFKALTRKQVEASNYPFCTIDPNVGVVKVPDERSEKLAQLYQTNKIIYATIEFVDIAGLVRNAHLGEGLGNQFLSRIREVGAIAHVIRNFKDDNIIHVEGKIDPHSDFETIEIELAMADLNTLEKNLIKLKDKIKAGDKEAQKIYTLLIQLKASLDQGKKPDISQFKSEEFKMIKNLNLLTLKPELRIENVDEKSLINCQPSLESSIPICAKLEAELAELPEVEARQYLKSLNITQTGLDRLIISSYRLLNLITFFTAGPKEAHAWTIPQDTKAPQAAGKIHTDFEKGFIRAEVVNWQELITAGGEVKAREKGLIRTEGKNYLVQDGDVVVIKFAP